MTRRLPLFLTTAFLLLAAAPAFGQKKGDIVVATRQTQMKTNTFMFKLPVEAQRGERWEILKYSKGKVVLTFGPHDERRVAMAELGIRMTVGYEMDGRTFAEGFVLETDWPSKRKSLASELQKRFVDLSLEQCEKLLDGELWVGMTCDQAMESIGSSNRILRKEVSETANGKTESWKVGAFSLNTTAQSTVAVYNVDNVFSSPSHPQEPLDVKAERDLERNVRMVLTFKDGVLDEIVRRR
jgi:hypothetical protein